MGNVFDQLVIARALLDPNERKERPIRSSASIVMTSAILPFNSVVENPDTMTGIPSKCPINSRGSPSAESNLNPKAILIHLDRSIDSSKEQEGCDKSFLASGCSAIYVFLYSILYFQTRLSINMFVGKALYFGYMALISYTFFLLAGSIGFIATFLFLRAIYGSIKVD
jgi:hypothetical protein